jgi:hypothetical protein
VVAAGWPREAVVEARCRAEETSSRALAQRVAPSRRTGWTEERYVLPSDLSYDNYCPNRWWALCPGCGARTVVRESTIVRLLREAADAGEAVLYIQARQSSPIFRRRNDYGQERPELIGAAILFDPLSGVYLPLRSRSL